MCMCALVYVYIEVYCTILPILKSKGGWFNRDCEFLKKNFSECFLHGLKHNVRISIDYQCDTASVDINGLHDLSSSVLYSQNRSVKMTS